MGIRVGTGPVFVYESITQARRWQGYALRAVFVSALLVVLWTVWQTFDGPNGLPSRITFRELARVGERFFHGMAAVQIGLVLLAAPAATASAVCLDRARGTLTHMLVTDLSDSEIVLGKLAARLLPVAALVAAGFPVLALAALLGGVIPEALLTLTLVTASIACFGCALALWLSVRLIRAQEVLICVFAVLLVWLISAPLWYSFARSGAPRPPDWFGKLNPFILAYSPYASPGFTSLWDTWIFVGLLLACSALLAWRAIACLRIEPRAERGRSEVWDRRLGALRARLWSWWPSPRLDPNPVLWREWHRSRPGRVGRLVRNTYLAAIGAGFLIGIREVLAQGVSNGPTVLILTNFLGVGFGLLMLSVMAPSALTEERTRGSLDVLMSTPMKTRAIVMGKWWGVYRRWLPLVLLPVFTSLFIAPSVLDTPTWMPARMQPPPVPLRGVDRWLSGMLPAVFTLAHMAAITSLGLALAVWIERPARAVGTSVAVLVIVGFGWIAFVEAIVDPWLRRGRAFTNVAEIYSIQSITMGVNCLSPVAGQIIPYEHLMNSWLRYGRESFYTVAYTCALILAGFAVVMLEVTIRTFDRRLGRVSETPHVHPPRAEPARNAAAPPPVGDPALARGRA